MTVTEDYVEEGYGIVTERVREAVRLLGRLEGIVADPVYSGKALAALIDPIRRRVFTRDHTVVFLHTGGAPACFA